jgi:hypothetical protein
MPMLEKLIESPYTALSVAIVLGALALSGKFNVTATQILLVFAWAVAIVGLRSTPVPIMLGSGAMIGGALILLGYWFRPDAIPSYSGVLAPRATLLFSARDAEASSIPKIQFGTSNVIYSAKEVGRDSQLGTLLFPALSENQFKIETISGKIKISTQIREGDGNLIAELVRNEWKVAPPPRTWDRNYSDDALEVKDASGAIVLQVRVFPDRIQIQGMWWWDMGPPNGIVRFFIRGNPTVGGQIVIVPIGNKDPLPSIDPMFQYPSDQHLGELNQ